jgi:hypothetical protein
VALLVDGELDDADDVGDDALGVLQADGEVVRLGDARQVLDVVGVDGLVVGEAVLVGGGAIVFGALRRSYICQSGGCSACRYGTTGMEVNLRIHPHYQDQQHGTPPSPRSQSSPS